MEWVGEMEGWVEGISGQLRRCRVESSKVGGAEFAVSHGVAKLVA